MRTKEGSEAPGMEWNEIREIAVVVQIHLKTHQEKPDLTRCKNQG